MAFSIDARTFRAHDRPACRRVLASTVLAFFLPRRSPVTLAAGERRGRKNEAKRGHSSWLPEQSTMSPIETRLAAAPLRPGRQPLSELWTSTPAAHRAGAAASPARAVSHPGQTAGGFLMNTTCLRTRYADVSRPARLRTACALNEDWSCTGTEKEPARPAAASPLVAATASPAPGSRW